MSFLIEILGELLLEPLLWILLYPVVWLLATPVILIVALFKPRPYSHSVQRMYWKVTDFWSKCVRESLEGHHPA